MGQQQLLFIILVSLVIGFSTLVTFNTVDEKDAKAGKEAIRQDIVRALGDAQTYYYTPVTEGGGGQTFQNITFQDLTLEPGTPNAMYTIVNDHHTLTLIGSQPAFNVRIEGKATIEADGSMKITWIE